MIDKERVDCPECSGRGRVWGDYNGQPLEGECPYCGGDGTALRRCVERDYPPASDAVTTPPGGGS